MKSCVFVVLTICILKIVQGLSCAPKEGWSSNLKTQFYQNWKDDKPFAEITVVEQFTESQYPTGIDFPPPPPDAGSNIFTVVRVDKVYTGCAPAVPYYALFKEATTPMLGIGTVFKPATKYVLPMPLRNSSEVQKPLGVPNCYFYIRTMENLAPEELDFLNARISCCGSQCSCLGEGRNIWNCPQGTCESQAPCGEATICRRNQCNYCAEEWYTSEWQVPCDDSIVEN